MNSTYTNFKIFLNFVFCILYLGREDGRSTQIELEQTRRAGKLRKIGNIPASNIQQTSTTLFIKEVIICFQSRTKQHTS